MFWAAPLFVPRTLSRSLETEKIKMVARHPGHHPRRAWTTPIFLTMRANPSIQSEKDGAYSTWEGGKLAMTSRQGYTAPITSSASRLLQPADITIETRPCAHPAGKSGSTVGMWGAPRPG